MNKQAFLEGYLEKIGSVPAFSRIFPAEFSQYFKNLKPVVFGRDGELLRASLQEAGIPSIYTMASRASPMPEQMLWRDLKAGKWLDEDAMKEIFVPRQIKHLADSVEVEKALPKMAFPPPQKDVVLLDTGFDGSIFNNIWDNTNMRPQGLLLAREDSSHYPSVNSILNSLTNQFHGTVKHANSPAKSFAERLRAAQGHDGLAQAIRNSHDPSITVDGRGKNLRRYLVDNVEHSAKLVPRVKSYGAEGVAIEEGALPLSKLYTRAATKVHEDLVEKGFDPKSSNFLFNFENPKHRKLLDIAIKHRENLFSGNGVDPRWAYVTGYLPEERLPSFTPALSSRNELKERLYELIASISRRHHQYR